MSKRTRTITCVVAALLLVAGQAFAAGVQNIELSWQENTAVVRIDVEGQVRYTHQSEEPKNGKPHRVIVDILAATHELGAKSFHELPDCIVSSIRTSQFAVSPEKIVRVVLDLTSAPLYRVQSDKKAVYVYLTDRSSPAFQPWSSRSTLAKPVDTPKPAKPAAKKEIAVAPAPDTQEPAKSAVTAVPKADKKASQADAPDDKVLGYSDELDKPQPKAPGKLAVKAKAPAEDKVSSTPVTVAAVEKPSPAAPEVAKAPESKPKTESKQLAAAPQKESKSENKLKTVPKETKSSKQKPASKGESQVLAQKDQPKSKASGEKNSAAKETSPAQSNSKSTARFRRSPSDMKVAGTMVAEFPKRLVIKYKSGNRRDPFETLINVQKTNDNPIERRVPNVEGIRLVGIIESGSESNRALFEDNDGYGYILKSGDKVKNGYVLRVDANKVFFQIFEYGWSRTVALSIDEDY